MKESEQEREAKEKWAEAAEKCGKGCFASLIKTDIIEADVKFEKISCTH